MPQCRAALVGALLFGVLVAPRPARAQLGALLPGMSVDSTAYAFSPTNLLGAALGITSFSGGLADGEYLTLTIQPEVDLTALGLAQVGVGVYAPLRFQLHAGDDTTDTGGFRFRREDYDDANELLSIIRYVRYGQKSGGQALYARFGMLDGASVGYGQLVSFYRNEVGNDARRRGLALDVDLGMLGVETLYGTLADAGVYAARGYLRPFWRPAETGGGGGLGALALGVTLAGDLDGDGAYVNPDSSGAPFVRPADVPAADSLGFARGVEDGRLTTFGVDLAFPFLQGDGFALAAYADAAKILDYGWGGGGGLGLSIAPPAGLARFDARLELRYLGARYLPSFFNAFYEVERSRIVDSTAVDVGLPSERMVPVVQTRRNELLAQGESQGGIFGALAGTVLGLFRIEGTYQQLFGSDGEAGALARGGSAAGERGTGWLHLGATLGRPGQDLLVGRASFDRWNIGGDRSTLVSENDALFQAEVSAGLVQYVQLGLIYENAFQPIYEEGDQGKLLGHRRQNRFEPRVALLLPF
jgi:hypothetical protein